MPKQEGSGKFCTFVEKSNFFRIFWVSKSVLLNELDNAQRTKVVEFVTGKNFIVHCSA